MATNLQNLRFPVFLVSRDGYIEQDGDISYHISIFGSKKVLDNKGLSGTFAERRSQIPIKERKSIKIALYFLQDMIKLTGVKNNFLFIDSDGKTFRYCKSRFCRLTFHKIEYWARDKQSLQIYTKVEGFNFLFKSLRPPKRDQFFAGILRLDPKVFILYGFFDKKYDRTIRKV